VFLAVQILTPFLPLTLLNFVVFFRLFYRKFNEDSKNVLKTVIFSLQDDFVCDCSFKLGFCQLTPLFSLTVPNFVMFLMSLDNKFSEDSKNVLKTLIFILKVDFTRDFLPDCPFKKCFWQFKL